MFFAGPGEGNTFDMKVSCIIPVRDRIDLIPRAIESVYRQNRRIDELVVIDDGSVDGTGAMISTYYSDIVLLATSGQGPGTARNMGVSAATGDLIMFLDSDDCWHADHVERLLGVIEKGYAFAYGITRNINQVTQDDFLIPDQGNGLSGNCFHALTKWCFMVPSSVAVTRDAFMECGGFPNIEMGEDWVFFLNIASRYPFGFTDECITTRYLHDGSICSQPGIKEKIVRLLNYLKICLSGMAQTTEQDFVFIQHAMEIAGTMGGEWKTFQDFFNDVKV